ncbi:DsrE family protein [Christiangramia salexigens]|uniref:Sulfur reduction protein DsrE n=1 Tax=Christiangramia salexigens TaxID=1913577 RepID=A0A1L3J3X7_9FLAO|nr:DsrE family protein [Christiangramia salexigens]APG59810.1 sulfur reduction protein DsrE [Christiangramia salexigens]
MRTILLSSFILMLSLFSSTVKAQENAQDKENHVVLTRKIPQLKPIILSAKELAKEDGDKFGDFQVVICGKTVQNLTDEEKISSFIEMAKANKVSLVACGFSIEKFKVDSSKIPKDIKIVKNGILHNLRLQKQGYKSIEL